MNMFDETGVNAAPAASDGGPTAEVTAAEEIRQLLADLREAAADGRFLARRYAELLTQAVDDYCGEFEQRAETVLARLEEVR